MRYKIFSIVLFLLAVSFPVNAQLMGGGSFFQTTNENNNANFPQTCYQGMNCGSGYYGYAPAPAYRVTQTVKWEASYTCQSTQTYYSSRSPSYNCGYSGCSQGYGYSGYSNYGSKPVSSYAPAYGYNNNYYGYYGGGYGGGTQPSPYLPSFPYSGQRSSYYGY